MAPKTFKITPARNAFIRPYLLFLGILAFLPITTHAATITFEADQGYSIGSAIGQPGTGTNKWQGMTDGTGNGNIEIITGSTGLPVSPQGSQFLQVRQTTTGSSNYGTQLKFTDTPVTLSGGGTLSVLLAYSGTSVNSYFTLSSSTHPSSQYYGIMFGFQNGSLAYRDGGTWKTLGTASQNVFYEFEVTILSNTTYSLTISDLSGQELSSVGSATIRVASNQTINTFDFISLNLYGATLGTNGLYADNINIMPIPEPSAVALLGSGVAGLLCVIARKKNVIAH